MSAIAACEAVCRGLTTDGPGQHAHRVQAVGILGSMSMVDGFLVGRPEPVRRVFPGCSGSILPGWRWKLQMSRIRECGGRGAIRAVAVPASPARVARLHRAGR